MDKEIIARLDVIADLMRRRLELEQQRDAKNKADRAEALERMREFKLDLPKLEMPQMESQDQFTAKLEATAEQDRQERNAFQEALLAELRRQSEALEKLAQARQ